MLKGLVAANLVASGAHFLHNAVLLDSYPGPLWIPGPWFVVIAWCFVAAALVLGYTWHRQGKVKRAFLAVTAYCVSTFLVFGHYLYGSPRDFDVLTNVLIFAEGISGMALFVYFVGWSQRSFDATADRSVVPPWSDA